MGQLLLKGWTMLEECCDECSVPLMRSRDKKVEYCVQCKRNLLDNTASSTVEQKPV